MGLSIDHSVVLRSRHLSCHAICLLAALIALLIWTPAQAQVSRNFGRTSVGTIPSNGLSGDFKRASRFTLSEPGTAFHLCAYLDGNGGVSGTQQVRLALYQDAGGTPGAKVMQTDPWIIVSGAEARWYCYGQQAYTPLAAGSYWIAIHSGGSGGVIRDFYDGPANWYGNTDSFSDDASSTFGVGNSGSGTLSLFVRYYPDAEIRNAGRTTIGSLPSNGMTANFKRGSSFVMPEAGRLNAVTTYLDGGGSTVTGDEQVFRYVIYDDANGLPGAKVYEGGDVYLRGGSPARWRTATISPAIAPTLAAGRYWIVLQTGSVGGVVRNFADGSGNWYGNGDDYTDGASPSFGVGNSGNGTISAFVSYQPGSIHGGTIGRTDAAIAPSAGLTANFMRWSSFTMLEQSGVLTGLHAYLDGLGGASGAQSLRMVLYKLDVDRDPDRNEIGIYRKVAESAEVVVPAGMQPQWVDFPVASVSLPNNPPPVYLVGILSGAAGGVARDYGDVISSSGFGSWGGMPEIYADGAPNEFRDDADYSFSDVQLSVYASLSPAP